MPKYRLSRLASQDLGEIADYTVDHWGLEQARRYIRGLLNFLDQLAQSPRRGKACDDIRQGYRRIEYEKHIVIYRIEDKGIFVSRVFHRRMQLYRHIIEDK